METGTTNQEKEPTMALVDRICKNKQCGLKFKAKSADVKRGWGLYCSKSCKAVHQENRTGQYARYKWWNSLNEYEQKQVIHDQIEAEIGYSELSQYG